MIIETPDIPHEYKVKVAQQLRLRRFLMAVATYIVMFLATFLITRLGLGHLSMTQWIALIGLWLCGLGLFFLMFYTGVNLRFSEPSLTKEQIIFSAIFGAVIMYWLPEARPIILLFFLPGFSFGILILTLPRYLVVVGGILGVYAGVLGLEFYQHRQGFDIQYELYLFVLFSLLLLWLAFFGGFVSKIKRRLRAQKVENQKSLDLIKIEIKERRRTEKALAESDSLRELLLDIITHDLRNPAGVIYGMSDMAHTKMPENKLIEHIYSSSERLMKVLENTSILSRAVFGETIEKEEIDLKKMLSAQMDDNLPALHEAGMALELNFRDSIFIQANPIISQVFRNFISNAIKYAREGKKILIEAVEKNDAVLIAVKDFGETILEEERQKIFERKYQLENDKSKGRGLGLAIVKRIAEAHDGEVWVEPNKPKGNSFYLRIPR